MAEIAKSDKREDARDVFSRTGYVSASDRLPDRHIRRLVRSTRPVSRLKSADGADVPDAHGTVQAQKDATCSALLNPARPITEA